MKRSIKLTGCTILLGLGIAVLGCEGATDETGSGFDLTKEEARAMGGKADNGFDLCELFGWYGDGICDEFCPLPDPDCGYCESNLDCDPSEFCKKSMSDCDGRGTCEIRPDFCIQLYDPVCGCDERTYGNECFAWMHGVNVEYSGVCISEGEYDPCGGKECGDSCTICDPNDLDCFETAVLKYCDLDGVCSPTYPDCGGGEYDPCGTKECGDYCKICPPGDPNCIETAVVKKCNIQGICLPGEPVCEPAADPLSCKDRCNDSSPDQACYCDEFCIDYGDCCVDFEDQCL